MNNSNNQKKNGPLNKAAHLTGAGLQMGLTIYLFNVLGGWLDHKFDKGFYETGLTLLGIFASIYLMIKQVVNISK